MLTVYCIATMSFLATQIYFRIQKRKLEYPAKSDGSHGTGVRISSMKWSSFNSYLAVVVFVGLIALSLVFASTPQDVALAYRFVASTFFFVLVPINTIAGNESLKTFVKNELAKNELVSAIVGFLSKRSRSSSVSPA